jgi:hypothetical protein
MTDTPEIGGVTLPDTKKYRVTGLGAVYSAPTEIIGPDGVPRVAYVTHLATRAQVVDLVAGEARRLSALNAVRPAGEPPTYDEMDEAQLAVLATSRGVAVRSSSADPDRPLREDYINALFTHDLGSDDAVLRGVGTVPGGVITPESGAGTPEVLIDGVHPNPPTEQADSVDTSPADEAAGRIGLTSQQAADQATGRSGGGVFDARGKSATELSDWISSEKPNAPATIAAAHDDPATARTLIEAEQAAQGGDGRSTVVDKLAVIADRDEG